MFVDPGLVGLAAVAPDQGSGGSQVAGGAELRLDLGWKWVAGTVALRGLSPTQPTFAGYRVDLARVPVSLGARFQWKRGRWSLFSGLELSLSTIRLAGHDLLAAQIQVRLELGLSVPLGVKFWIRPWVAVAVVAGVDVAFERYRVFVNGAGGLGNTPRAWVDVGLGMTFRVRSRERF